MGKKILIIDDEEKFVEMVKIWLESEGYNVFASFDGEKGHEMVKQENPDLVILDLMLPGINGHRLCSMLKNDPQYQNIPIILFTAFAQASGERIAKESGADAYIVKPFEQDQLLSTIKGLLKQS